MATTSNPFLNPNTPNPVQNVFNADIILNSNKKENHNNDSLFNAGSNKTNLFNNNMNDQKNPMINNQGMRMNNGGMDMSPKRQPINLFNNIQNNNNSLFNNTNGFNIFGAPNSTNGNSLFNNNNFQQSQNTGGLFGQGIFSSGINSNSSFCGFSLGKKS